ncbi:hypothetical protein [Chitinophaga sp. 212800010-3]|uniref:hypothetical protein n=1 Tax=unclassified Chitinophaga TaxID=2619133 RepID=UPI002DF1AA42|nr:Endosialidase-like protein [Chitinophaga sp. 212800010-3]
MKQKTLSHLFLCCIFFTGKAVAQQFDSLYSAGINKSIVWNTSPYGSGFGHRIYSTDPGGRTDLRIAARSNSAVWQDVMTITTSGNVGVGTEDPLAGLHVAKVVVQSNGERAAAILGNAYNDWTYFGALSGGKIRGSNEGYLDLETNTAGSDKNLYMNFASSGNVIIAKGGGNVSIGTAFNNGYKLAVNGTIGARKVRVEQSTWADFVFHPEYKLPTLQYVADYIASNNHLPDIPSEKEVKEDGIDLGDMNRKLLQKVEELTLYLISQEKKLESVQQRVLQLEKENAAMRKKQQ